MATVESQLHSREQQPPPASSDAMALDTSLNGAAVQHNNISAFSYDSREGQPQLNLPQVNILASTSAVSTSEASPPANPVQEQLSQVEIGGNPAAPYIDHTSIKPSSPITRPSLPFQAAATTDVPGPTEQDLASNQTGFISATPQTLVPSATISQQLSTNGHNTVPQESTSGGRAPAQQEELVEESKASISAETTQSSELKPAATTHINTSLPAVSEVAASAYMEPAQPAESEIATSTQIPPHPPSATVDQEMTDVSQTSIKIAREREEDEDLEPAAKRAKTEDESAIEAEEASPIVPTTEIPSPATATATDQTHALVPDTTPNGSQAKPVLPVHVPTREEWGPMTDIQVKQLKQVIANMKKGRFANSFSKPVDPVALNIPTYFDVVKQPMDISTVDSKLKESKYGSVFDFITDFDLIVDNCIKFNGPTHAISLQGENLRAQFNAGLRKVSRAGEAATPLQPQLKKPARSSVSLPARDVKTRPSRPSLPSETTEQTFALGANGIPLTRRTSANDGRPKREIHRPPPRDLPYSSVKPKKKKYQMELKFCEHVLSELKKGRYAHLMSPFASPVDPVALNIPQYHKIVKKPMDFGTITDKLSGGQYENAKEFETDVNLVFENCFKFNGTQHPIAQLARQFQDIFSAEFSYKNSWIAHNAPSSAPQSPEAESDSDEEDEDDGEDEDAAEEARKAAELKAIHEQMAALNAKAIELANPTLHTKKSKPLKKNPKSAKTGGSKSVQRKSGPVATSRPVEKKPSKSKAKPARPLTKKEELEICNRMGELTGEETSTVYTWIQDGRRTEGLDPLPESPEGAIELTLEAIPNSILHRILGIIHSHDPQSDYRPVSSAAPSRQPAAPHKKKHKPMRMNEQTAAIERVQTQLASFDNQGLRTPSDSPTGPPGYNAQSDDDDDDSGSESEEE